MKITLNSGNYTLLLILFLDNFGFAKIVQSSLMLIIQFPQCKQLLFSFGHVMWHVGP